MYLKERTITRQAAESSLFSGLTFPVKCDGNPDIHIGPILAISVQYSGQQEKGFQGFQGFQARLHFTSVRHHSY
jgi:hypothetical protein